jgi:hypothetical protein
MPRLALALLLVVSACSPAAGDQAPVTTGNPATTSPTTSPGPTTTAALAAEPWAVVVVGDFGSGTEAQYTVAAAMQEWVAAHPETVALITTGDNFYTGDIAAAWEVPYGWVAESGLPVWATPGNHDVERPSQWQASVDAFGSFPRWRTKEVGGITFVLLDSNQAPDPVQMAWLEQVATGLQDRPWVAVFHHPMLSCGSHSEAADFTTAVWAPLLDGVRLVLNGHDHNYQRFETKDGFRVITGGGGRALHPIETCITDHPDLQVAVSAHHFLSIEVSGETATVTAHGTDGTVLDRFLVDLGMRP